MKYISTYTVVRRRGKFLVYLESTAFNTRKRPLLCCPPEGFRTELEAWAFVRRLTKDPPHFVSPVGGQRRAYLTTELGKEKEEEGGEQ